MDFTLNRIELRGNVGENARINRFADSSVARFTVATNYTYRDRDGNPVIETTWHNVVAWEGKGMPDFNLLTKGTAVQVTGRLRQSKFTNQDGEEKRFFEVVASRLQIISPEDFV